VANRRIPVDRGGCAHCTLEILGTISHRIRKANLNGTPDKAFRDVERKSWKVIELLSNLKSDFGALHIKLFSIALIDH
jgi:hypothetical protein